MSLYILDENNKAIPTEDVKLWGAWYAESLEIKRRVAVDDINNTRISTVFLGLDHGFGENHKPLLWETMCFSDNQDYNDYQIRYETYEEAVQGHKNCVDFVTKNISLNERKILKLRL
jgi:hypothetical protein